MASENESDAELEENYYTFLNLPRDATTEQINTAYRKQSRIYHPDKHYDVDSKKQAEIMFNRTKRAYEVLSDPHQRAIYDSVGVKGLRTEGWEIVHRTKTPAEIREEYERLAQAADERRLQQRTNPRGNITINVNATEIFAPYDETEMPRVEIGSMSIAQSIEAPLTRKDMIIMSGNLYSSNGNGSGGFVVAGRRLLNKGWLEVCAGAGNGFLVGLKVCTDRWTHSFSQADAQRRDQHEFPGTWCDTRPVLHARCAAGQAHGGQPDAERGSPVDHVHTN
ncbi:dnaJ homolog subfamily C member 11 isoform X3 [Drosophila obscura]|uniref:dnaJ homolog subfamily C member 11 isoform X3 n=1 Tax=Drosophila obscura TaxID=7282 RepID=UPI001BB15407|nr:dnaJ homolog subfamily C member 11 isoform X3 [Drosophila obscura]